MNPAIRPVARAVLAAVALSLLATGCNRTDEQAAESTNGFLADANDYTTNGNYIMPWVTNFQPNVDAYRAALVSAMNQYDADQSDANWELVKTAFVDGWATQYAAANG